MPKSRLQEMRVERFMSREVVTGTADEPVSEILGRMKDKGIHEIPIVEGKKLLGIVTMAAIARKKAPPDSKAKALMDAGPLATPDLDLPAAAELLMQSGHRSLPVEEKGRLVGILSRTDVIRGLRDSEEVQAMTARDMMTPQPQCVGPDDTIQQARTVMANLGERAVPVVDGDRRLVGVVGLKDIAGLFAKPSKHARSFSGEKGAVSVSVSSIMQPPVSVTPDAKLTQVFDLMTEHRISTMIVHEDDKPVGVITGADLMELAARFREREGVLVQISGLEEQPDVYEQIYDLVQKAMRRISALVTPRLMNLHIVQYKADGDHSKWSVRMRFSTDRETYHFKHFDWELFKALNTLLDQLEMQVKKEKDRRIAERKRRRS